MTLSISANSPLGRVLLALRPGPMASEALDERIPSHPSFTALAKKGLITGDCNAWHLTEMGRLACPLRNPLSAKVTPPPSTALPKLTLNASSRNRNDQPSTGGPEMPTTNGKLKSIDMVRDKLSRHPMGIERKEIIAQSSFSRAAIDNAISFLVSKGEAVRKERGVIASAPGRSAIDNTAASLPRLSIKPEETDADLTNFSIHDDGRLVIVSGDQRMVIPPVALRRLFNFLGCFDMSQPG